MPPNPEVITYLEKRLDSRLDSLEKLLDNKIGNINERFESLEEQFKEYVKHQAEEKKEKIRDNRITTITILISVVGWIITILMAFTKS